MSSDRERLRAIISIIIASIFIAVIFILKDCFNSLFESSLELAKTFATIGSFLIISSGIFLESSTGIRLAELQHEKEKNEFKEGREITYHIGFLLLLLGLALITFSIFLIYMIKEPKFMILNTKCATIAYWLLFYCILLIPTSLLIFLGSRYACAFLKGKKQTYEQSTLKKF